VSTTTIELKKITDFFVLNNVLLFVGEQNILALLDHQNEEWYFNEQDC
jgi:hypothetical protein